MTDTETTVPAPAGAGTVGIPPAELPAELPAGPGQLGAPMVAALESAWSAIRARHLEVPPAVVVLAPGSGGHAGGRGSGGQLRLGHFGALRWQAAAGGEELSEVMVGGEGLARGPVDVLGTLLHEAAHALGFVRGVKDTSRQGRWHNRRYAALAEELGLAVAEAPGVGWSDTTVPDATAAAYTDTVDQLRTALRLYRRAEPAAGAGAGGRRSSNNPLAALCACPRRIRVAPTVLELGPIQCGLCGGEFLPELDDEDGDS